MSVGQSGARLLGEVQEESLDELLKELRAALNPTPKVILGSPQLDNLLELFRFHKRQSPPRHPGWTPTSRVGLNLSDDDSYEFGGNTTDLEGPRPNQSKPRPPIIEITSQKSAAGKTNLLHYVTALALIPSEYGGKESAAFWIDTDNRFSASRLSQTMSHLVSKGSSKFAQDLNSIIGSSLQHLYVLKPTSSTSLLSTLHSLPTHLLTHTSLSSLTRPLALLILDSATAFSPQDRFDADMARLEAPDSTRPSTSSRTSLLIASLRSIQEAFECTILFTTTHQPQPTRFLRLNPNPNQPGREQERMPDEPLPVSPWTSFATLTLTVSRIAVAQFAPSISLEECLRDRDKRQEAVAKGRFSAGLNWEGAEMWPMGVREALSGSEGRRRRDGFVVRVTGQGVDIE